MVIMTHAKFYFNRLMLTLTIGIRASETPHAWQMIEKVRYDRVKSVGTKEMAIFHSFLASTLVSLGQ